MKATQKRQFGPFLVQESLGAGGVAKVFKAIDHRDGRTVALKLLHTTFSEESDMGQRFKKEAEIVKALNHPCIVPVYDYGVLKGRPFVSMQYMAQGSLAQRFDVPSEITSQEVVRLLRRIASALDHAHRRGVIHRDIKLENILLDERGEASLADFGLAVVTGAHRVTISGDIVGTPAYMSPEQARGRKNLDARSDLYSFAIVTYLLTVGRLPFTGALLSLLNQQVHTPPPLPSQISPDLPAALDNVLLRGLAKNSKERYPTADAFIEAYAKVMSDHAPRRIKIDIETYQKTADAPLDETDDIPFWEEKPIVTADELVLAAKTAATNEEAVGYLRQALDLDQWHVEANRMRLKLEGAPSLMKTTVSSALVEPGQRLPEFKRKIWMTDAQRQRIERRKSMRRLGIISLVIFSMSCSVLTFSLIGVFPGVIGFMTQFLGGGKGVTEIDGVPIENMPNAAAFVEASKSREAPSQIADVIDHGYLHEYTFVASRGEEYYVYVQFMSVSANHVQENVVVLDPDGEIAPAAVCDSLGEGGLLGGEANTTITCRINKNGLWKVRLLGIRGESVGAYFIGVRASNDLD